MISSNKTQEDISKICTLNLTDVNSNRINYISMESDCDYTNKAKLRDDKLSDLFGEERDNCIYIDDFIPTNDSNWGTGNMSTISSKVMSVELDRLNIDIDNNLIYDFIMNKYNENTKAELVFQGKTISNVELDVYKSSGIIIQIQKMMNIYSIANRQICNRIIVGRNISDAINICKMGNTHINISDEIIVSSREIDPNKVIITHIAKEHNYNTMLLVINKTHNMVLFKEMKDCWGKGVMWFNVNWTKQS